MSDELREIELLREPVDEPQSVYCGYNGMTRANERYDRSRIEQSTIIRAENLMLVRGDHGVRLYSFPANRHGLPWIRLERENGRSVVRAGISYDGDGEPEETVFTQDFPDGGRALRAATAPQLRSNGKRGWCSWYHYFADIGQEVLRENLAVCAQREEMEVFQIDMGYSPKLGDWLEPGDGFVEPVTSVLRDARAAGKIPGIWLAPFTAEADSNLYRSHPDWFYADDTYPWKSESPPWKCMDLSVPEALDFVVDTVTQLHTAGARYFKLDFIDMALVPGRRRHTQRSGVELYRHALASIRAAAPDSYVLGCNPAMSATIDVVDALRIGEDTAPRWKPLESHGAGAHTALRTALGRTYLRASAEIDLDCMLLRQAKSSLTKGEIDTYVNAVIATGDQRFVSDDLSLVSAADLDAAFRKVDYPNRIAVPSRPLDEDEPSTFDIVEGEDTVGKLLVNWGDTDVCMVPFLALGPRATEFHDSATGEPVGNRDICLEPHQSLLAFRAM